MNPGIGWPEKDPCDPYLGMGGCICQPHLNEPSKCYRLVGALQRLQVQLLKEATPDNVWTRALSVSVSPLSKMDLMGSVNCWKLRTREASVIEIYREI